MVEGVQMQEQLAELDEMEAEEIFKTKKVQFFQLTLVSSFAFERGVCEKNNSKLYHGILLNNLRNDSVMKTQPLWNLTRVKLNTTVKEPGFGQILKVLHVHKCRPMWCFRRHLP